MVCSFNAEDSEEILLNFLEKHNAANILKDKTCLKRFDNPSCIDLFITNRPRFFHNTIFSNFHKMAVTVLKTSFSKAPPKELFYREYKNFEQDKFKYELKNRTQNEQLNVLVHFERFWWIY